MNQPIMKTWRVTISQNDAAYNRQDHFDVEADSDVGALAKAVTLYSTQSKWGWPISTYPRKTAWRIEVLEIDEGNTK